MKVLLYSHFFYPTIGGIESISASLADQLLEAFQPEVKVLEHIQLFKQIIKI